MFKRVVLVLIIVLGICAMVACEDEQENLSGEKLSGDTLKIENNIEEVEYNTHDRYVVFYSVLREYFYNKKWIDGSEVEPTGFSTEEDGDAYAIFDIDGDGKDELIIRHSGGTMAGMLLEIYDYDNEEDLVILEYVGSPFSAFYKNGVIRKDASHNQGKAYGFMWPHSLEKYDADKDTYYELAYIDGYDKQFEEDFPMYVESEGHFPEDVDKDGNGGVYQIFEPNDDVGRYVDDDEFEAWMQENVGELEEIKIPFILFSAENIRNTKKQYEIVDDTIMFEEYYDEAEKLVSEMTIQEKIAQMFLVMYPGDAKAMEEIEKYNPGGYILFAKDVADDTPESLKARIQKLQDASKVKMMIAVDEEGGTVVRVSGYKQYRDKKFDSPRNIYENSGMDAVVNDAHEKDEFLKNLGINMNLAPVVDLPTNSSSYMYKRAIDINEETASEFTRKVVSQMNEDKVISSLKHFPGYGDNVDTHTGIAIDERTKEDFLNKDFKPFIAGIEAKAPSIMVNHNIIKNIDDKYPASISKDIHDILRYELNYTGLIVTDALSMDAIKKYVDDGQAGTQAVIAGNDMIISATLESHIKEIVNALNDGRVTENQINMAAKRVVACKLAFGI